MAAGENEHISIRGPQPDQHAIGTGANLRGRFAAGTAVAKQLPVGSFPLNFHRPAAFVFAVVPFHEIRVGFRALAETSEVAASRGALQRACEHFGEGPAEESAAQLACLLFAVLSKRQIG